MKIEVKSVAQVLRMYGKLKLAKELGIPPSNVTLWSQRGWIPIKHVSYCAEKFGIPARFLVKPEIAEIFTSPNQAEKQEIEA